MPREVGNFERDRSEMMLNTENSPILCIHSFAELNTSYSFMQIALIYVQVLYLYYIYTIILKRKIFVSVLGPILTSLMQPGFCHGH